MIRCTRNLLLILVAAFTLTGCTSLASGMAGPQFTQEIVASAAIAGGAPATEVMITPTRVASATSSPTASPTHTVSSTSIRWAMEKARRSTSTTSTFCACTPKRRSGSVHFALNCASRSCPPISFYDAARIDAQLDLAAAGFIAADVAIDPEHSIVRLSSIFK